MSRFRDKSAFVTGGTGFVGSHLVDLLLGAGFGEVRCLVRKELKWLEGKPIVRIDGDLDSRSALREGCQGVDYVFHIAGITGTKSQTSAEYFYAANVEATKTLMAEIKTLAPGVRKVLVTSSLAVVGRCDEVVCNEESARQPVSEYGRSKAAMEQMLARHAEDLPIVIIRPPSVYGPRDTDILTFFDACSKGFAPALGNPDRKEVSLVHVRDLVRGMLMAAESDKAAGTTYFIGNRKIYSWREVAEMTAETMGSRVRVVRLPRTLVLLVGRLMETARKLSKRHLPFDTDKAREAVYGCKACSSEKAWTDFGWMDTIGLAEGIAETIDWYREIGWLKVGSGP